MLRKFGIVVVPGGEDDGRRLVASCRSCRRGYLENRKPPSGSVVHVNDILSRTDIQTVVLRHPAIVNETVLPGWASRGWR